MRILMMKFGLNQVLLMGLVHMTQSPCNDTRPGGWETLSKRTDKHFEKERTNNVFAHQD